MNKPRHLSGLYLASIGAAALALAACDIDQTQVGDLPDVDVSEGQLPEFDVEGPDIDVDIEERQIEVPDVDVDTETRTVPVPDIDVDLPDEDDDETSGNEAAPAN